MRTFVRAVFWGLLTLVLLAVAGGDLDPFCNNDPICQEQP